ncbi:MAG: hypothetical protein KF892_23580 [Rhizobacter sp.]|nr:hypothetical protein [Rhizobacter sp.]
MPQTHFSGRRRVLLGLVAGVVAFFGLETILSEVALLIGRGFLVAQDAYTAQSWPESRQVAGSLGWYVIEGIATISAAIAAYTGSWLSPRRSKAFVIFAVALFLTGTLFSQLPNPSTSSTLIIWALAPVVGVLVGVGLQWLYAGGDA